MNRGDVAVAVVGAGTDEDLRAHTPTGVPILEVGSESEAFEQAAPADVILVRPGCRVAAGWAEALQDAAHAGATTATATALTQHDLGVAADPFEPAAAAVRSASLRVRPRIETPGDAACVYVRRSAIELIGEVGEIGEESFWRRCVELGLAHVLADDVLVLDPGPAPVGPGESNPAEPTAPLTRAHAAARRALRGLCATIDARILYGPTTGTQVHVLELIAGLARTDQVRLTVILPDQPSEHALTRLRATAHLELVTYRDASRAGTADVVHRPFQLSNAGDLDFLKTLGDRLILTQQDLIAFHNPAYFPSADAWREYRDLTRLALDSADSVLFFSAHARDDALSEELLDPGRANVVQLGVDHPAVADPPGAAPAGADRIAGSAMLCLGTDLLHKNRLFALRILDRLRTEHGWDGTLVFAGPTVALGSSHVVEQQFMAAHPHLAPAVLDLGPVTEAEKSWLFERCDVVVYPTVLEGFGLVPFEAAAHRRPCLWAPGSSLSELLPDEAAVIVPWDEVASARNALALINDQTTRERNLNAIATAAQVLTWDATARRLLDVYRATAEAPARPRIAGGLALTEDAARLVGPGGELPADVHRPLLALATHPRLAKPAYAALRLGYRASQRVRQRWR